MKIQLNTAGYEENIASISIIDDGTQAPKMEILLKSIEIAKKYRNLLFVSVRMNEVSINEGYDNITPLNFSVTVSDNTVTVCGNIVNALKLLKREELLLPFVCDNMLLKSDEEELMSFFSSNKQFAFREPEEAIVNNKGLQDKQTHKHNSGLKT
jgi:hypothetical protein